MKSFHSFAVVLSAAFFGLRTVNADEACNYEQAIQVCPEAYGLAAAPPRPVSSPPAASVSPDPAAAVSPVPAAAVSPDPAAQVSPDPAAAGSSPPPSLESVPVFQAAPPIINDPAGQVKDPQQGQFVQDSPAQWAEQGVMEEREDRLVFRVLLVSQVNQGVGCSRLFNRFNRFNQFNQLNQEPWCSQQ
ncbi:MAG: hypothetical protein M1833_001488 [Piccolia ochrophora]|nr:MAG: hypothetical protein M1833_001488 [Piccolia ochrophora]